MHYLCRLCVSLLQKLAKSGLWQNHTPQGLCPVTRLYVVVSWKVIVTGTTERRSCLATPESQRLLQSPRGLSVKPRLCSMRFPHPTDRGGEHTPTPSEQQWGDVLLLHPQVKIPSELLIKKEILKSLKPDLHFITINVTGFKNYFN